jgi:putative transposase
MFLRADPALHSRPEREVTQVCMERAYKFRIYPTSEQETLLQKTFGCARYVYNYYLNKRMTAYQTDKTTLNYYACSADLTRLKKEKDWLREPDKFALQSALRNLDDAYQRFFDRVQKGEAPGYPKFKSKHDRDRSYTTRFTNGNIKVLDKHVRLPKLGLVKCRISRQVEDRILSATVSQKSSGKYFVSITCTDVVQESLKPTGAIVSYRENLICTETLIPKNMVKNRKLAKAISDAAWGEVARQLEYKTLWYGRALIKVDRFYASSQTCNVCGCKNSETKNLTVREWDCPNCGTHHDRDANGARNIPEEGLRIVNTV